MSTTPFDSTGGKPRPYQPRAGSWKRPKQVQAAMKKDAERKLARCRPNRIPVPLVLTAPHPLVVATSKSLAGAKPGGCGLVQPQNGGCLAVVVRPALVDRALLILDTLVKAMEAKGWSIQPAPENASSTRVRIGAGEVGFYLEELVDSRPHIPTAEEKRKQREDPILFSIPQRDRVPSGRLRLVVQDCRWGRGNWADSTRWRVEECLDLCLEAMEKTAELPIPSGAETQCEPPQAEPKRQEVRPTQERVEPRGLHRPDDEQVRIRLLNGYLERLRMAEQVRRYASRLEEAAKASGAEVRVAPWLAWVRQHADRLDPCQPEVVLNDADLRRSLDLGPSHERMVADHALGGSGQ